jgi:hypothetical protein
MKTFLGEHLWTIAFGFLLCQKMASQKGIVMIPNHYTEMINLLFLLSGIGTINLCTVSVNLSRDLPISLPPYGCNLKLIFMILLWLFENRFLWESLELRGINWRKDEE